MTINSLPRHRQRGVWGGHLNPIPFLINTYIQEQLEYIQIIYHSTLQIPTDADEYPIHGPHYPSYSQSRF